MEPFIAGLSAERYRPAAAKFKSPLILVHGVWSGPWCWQSGPPIFVISDGTCFAIELRRRFYKIRWGTFTTSASTTACKHLREVVRSVSNPPVLLAMNLGALMALKVCEQSKPSALILVSPSPPGNLTGAQIAAATALVAQV